MPKKQKHPVKKKPVKKAKKKKGGGKGILPPVVTLYLALRASNALEKHLRTRISN